MKIFGIAGFKNSGKTTLVVELLHELRGRGFRVATIKHAHHEFDIDHPGKDSYLHREAGAEEVIISSSRRWAHICELRDGSPDDSSEPSLTDLLEKLGEVDIVLVEGYKYGTHPRLELRRAGQDHPGLAEADSAIVAIVSDAPEPGARVPLLDRANLTGIADFILETAAES